MITTESPPSAVYTEAMLLRTLGGLAIEGSSFSRPKPLLLLAYLALEGPQDRRHLAELFWPEAADHMSSLTVALAQLRQGVPGVVVADEKRLGVNLETDIDGFVAKLERGELEAALELYRGAFLGGFYQKPLGSELEEWLYETRERLAARALEAMLSLAEAKTALGRFEAAAGRAERAYRLSGAVIEPAELARLHTLLLAGTSPLANEVSREAESFGLTLPSSPDEARAALQQRATPHNLPAPSFFVGRQAELARLGELLAEPEVQLLTLVGPGGVGKTRLALEVAAAQLGRGAFADGVYFAPLAALSAGDLLASSIARVLGLPESARRSSLESLIEHLQDKRLLLVLDNLEQLAASAADLTHALLERCPQLKVLATSRAPLHLRRERQVPVSPLPLPEALPDDLASLAETPAVALFLHHAQNVEPDFALTDVDAPAILEICRRLDGLPLALELAAARIKLFAPHALLKRLSQRLELLTGGSRDAPERHQTLRAALAGSYDLLEATEQQLFRHLGVFVGGFTLEAAETVNEALGASPGITLDAVAALVDKSLLRRQQLRDEGRFTLLETIREFALERLEETGEAEAALQAHTSYLLGLAEAAQPELTGPEQQRWLTRLEAEHDNLRAVLVRAEKAGDTATGLRLGAALWRFWVVRGHMGEGRGWLARFLAHPVSGGEARERADALNGLGTLTHEIGDFVVAQALLEEALELYRRLGDEANCATVLNHLGWVAYAQGQGAAARGFTEEALELHRRFGNRRGLAVSLNNLGFVAARRGRVKEAEAHFAEGLRLRQELGDERGSAFTLTNLGWVAWLKGEYAEAGNLLDQALAVLQRLGDRQLMAWALEHLGNTALEQGVFAEAEGHFAESLRLMREAGNLDSYAETLTALAEAAFEQQQPALARKLLDEAFATWGEHGNLVAVARAHLLRARLALAEGWGQEAEGGLVTGLRLCRDLGDDLGLAQGLETRAYLDFARGRLEPAARLLGLAAAHREELGTPLSPRRQSEHDTYLLMLRTGLGEDAFLQVWRQGQADALELTVAALLEET